MPAVMRALSVLAAALMLMSPTLAQHEPAAEARPDRLHSGSMSDSYHDSGHERAYPQRRGPLTGGGKVERHLSAGAYDRNAERSPSRPQWRPSPRGSTPTQPSYRTVQESPHRSSREAQRPGSSFAPRYRQEAPRRGVNDVIQMVERRYGGKVVGVEQTNDHYQVRLLQRDGRVRTLHVPADGY